MSVNLDLFLLKLEIREASLLCPLSLFSLYRVISYIYHEVKPMLRGESRFFFLIYNQNLKITSPDVSSGLILSYYLALIKAV